MTTAPNVLPEDHTPEVCAKRGCVPPFHYDEDNFCLACGGCGDPECCSHDEMCVFDK